MNNIYFKNHMDFMRLKKESLLSNYSEQSGFKKSICQTLEYLILEYPDNTDLIRKYRNDLKNADLECALCLDKINNISANLFGVIKYLLNNKVVNHLIPEDEKPYLHLGISFNANKIKILDRHDNIVLEFYISSDLMVNKVLSNCEIRENSYFYIGKFSGTTYVSFKHKFENEEYSINASDYGKQTTRLNKLFADTPYVFTAFSFESIEPINKEIRTIDDLYKDFTHEGFNLLLEDEFLAFLYTKNKKIWNRLNINDENHNEIFKGLINISKLFKIYDYDTFFKVASNKESSYIRIYFHSEKHGLNIEFYIPIDGTSSDISDKAIYSQESSSSSRQISTELPVSSIFNGHFLEYKKLLKY